MAQSIGSTEISRAVNIDEPPSNIASPTKYSYVLENQKMDAEIISSYKFGKVLGKGIISTVRIAQHV